jgi:hypothetical protein
VFEKMEVGSSARKHPRGSTGGVSGKDKEAKSLFPAVSGSLSGSGSGGGLSASLTADVAEWVLTAPVLSSVAQALIGLSSLDAQSTARSRARFVESVFFAGAVFGVILSAAMPEIRMLLSS